MSVDSANPEDQAIYALQGLLEGISLDRETQSAELTALGQWREDYRALLSAPTLQELFRALDHVLAQANLSAAAREDLIFQCRRLRGDRSFDDVVIHDFYRLQGMLAGVLADGEINEFEAKALHKWVQENDHLMGAHPYDRVAAVLQRCLADGRLSVEEREELRRTFVDITG